MSLEGIDNIHGGDCFAASVFSVSDCISDDVLEESLEHLPGVIIDERGDSLDSASSGESSDSGLGDALNRSSAGLLCVPLDADLADSLASFSLSCHFKY